MGLDGFNEKFVSHQQYMCPQAPMGEWRDSIILIIYIYISSGLNGLSDGLVSSGPYMRHQASMG